MRAHWHAVVAAVLVAAAVVGSGVRALALPVAVDGATGLQLQLLGSNGTAVVVGQLVNVTVEASIAPAPPAGTGVEYVFAVYVDGSITSTATTTDALFISVCVCVCVCVCAEMMMMMMMMMMRMTS
jgi:hypothetical protein